MEIVLRRKLRRDYVRKIVENRLRRYEDSQEEIAIGRIKNGLW